MHGPAFGRVLLKAIDQASVARRSSSTAAVRRPAYHLATGIALFAKRSPRPFPPPFHSIPSGSFSDPLSTHHSSQWRNDTTAGRRSLLRGLTNGDDAVYASEYFIGANDGVGAWSTRPGGHAGLWARLIMHYWAGEVEQFMSSANVQGASTRQTNPADGLPFHGIAVPSPVEYLQKAYEATVQACTVPNKWQGTTTAAGAQLFCPSHADRPVLYITNLGDSQVMVIRPNDQRVIFKTKEQWHWFDCPRQLGTNSLDTPRQNAVLDEVEICEHDIVIAMTDGVTDNLWEHEIVTAVVDGLQAWNADQSRSPDDQSKPMHGSSECVKMRSVARRIMKAARVIAEDPFAESPYMERNIEEGLAMEGGKLDDISVVVAECRRSAG